MTSRTGLALLLVLLVAGPSAAKDYPVDREVLAGVSAEAFPAMRAKIAALEAETAAHYGESVAALERHPGTRTYVRSSGATRGDVVELTNSVVTVSLDDFLASIPAARWGPNLAHYAGGEVIPLPRLGAGRQIERMVLCAPGPNQDMTKIEEVVPEHAADGTLTRVTVYWEVIHSDNGTVIRDVGSIRFARLGAGRTLVTTHSGHKFGGFPFQSGWIADSLKAKLTAASLRIYFTDHAKHYAELAVERTVARRARAIARGIAARIRQGE